jgi:hypothetical protein
MMTTVQKTTDRTIVVRLLSAIGALGIAGAFALPLMVPTVDAAGMWLVQAIPGLAEAGQGPYQGEALLASVAIGVAAIALAVGIVTAILLAARPESRRLARTAQVVAVIVLVGCAGIGLLVLVLTGMWDGRVFPISPAACVAAVGAALLFVASLLAPRRLVAPAPSRPVE